MCLAPAPPSSGAIVVPRQVTSRVTKVKAQIAGIIRSRTGIAARSRAEAGQPAIRASACSVPYQRTGSASRAQPGA